MSIPLPLRLLDSGELVLQNLNVLADAEIKRLEEENATLQSQTTTLSNEKTKFSGQNFELTEQNSELSEQNSELIEQNSKLETKCSENTTMIQALTKINNTQSEQIQTLKDVNNRQSEILLQYKAVIEQQPSAGAGNSLQNLGFFHQAPPPVSQGTRASANEVRAGI